MDYKQFLKDTRNRIRDIQDEKKENLINKDVGLAELGILGGGSYLGRRYQRPIAEYLVSRAQRHQDRASALITRDRDLRNRIIRNKFPKNSFSDSQLQDIVSTAFVDKNRREIWKQNPGYWIKTRLALGDLGIKGSRSSYDTPISKAQEELRNEFENKVNAVRKHTDISDPKQKEKIINNLKKNYAKRGLDPNYSKSKLSSLGGKAQRVYNRQMFHSKYKPIAGALGVGLLGGALAGGAISGIRNRAARRRGFEDPQKVPRRRLNIGAGLLGATALGYSLAPARLRFGRKLGKGVGRFVNKFKKQPIPTPPVGLLG